MTDEDQTPEKLLPILKATASELETTIVASINAHCDQLMSSCEKVICQNNAALAEIEAQLSQFTADDEKRSLVMEERIKAIQRDAGNILKELDDNLVLEKEMDPLKKKKHPSGRKTRSTNAPDEADDPA